VSFEEPIATELMEAAIALLASPEGWSVMQRSAHDAFFGGAHAIWKTGETLEASADPRRDGAVAAE
jgi:gamma-glutamyltranspeptidase